jgi:hypothetical protein
VFGCLLIHSRCSNSSTFQEARVVATVHRAELDDRAADCSFKPLSRRAWPFGLRDLITRNGTARSALQRGLPRPGDSAVRCVQSLAAVLAAAVAPAAGTHLASLPGGTAVAAVLHACSRLDHCFDPRVNATQHLADARTDSCRVKFSR